MWRLVGGEMARGYFGIGVEHSKSTQNVGTLWRTAYAFDAALLCTIGRRYDHQITDTVKAVNHVPLQHFLTLDAFFAALPFGCLLIGVELDPRAKELRRFKHPERAFYLLGAEDNGLSRVARERCHSIVMLPGRHCLNVAVAGSIVLAHRIMQHEREDALLADSCAGMVRQQLAS
jgi:tRNA G18 (ribose-2'-O)-methylase SpoU